MMFSERDAPAELFLQDEHYTRIKNREFSEVSVYRGIAGYLRAGDPSTIAAESAAQKCLYELGYPVPRVINEGFDDQIGAYFLEDSMGDEDYEMAFTGDLESTGSVSDANLRKYTNKIVAFVSCQIGTQEEFIFNDWTTERLVPTEAVQAELPDKANRIYSAITKAKQNLAQLPVVITHGDLKPSNIFSKGVIDLETLSYAPLGYDVSTSIYDSLILDAGFVEPELLHTSHLSPAQVSMFISKFDRIFMAQGYSSFSDVKNDFMFLRALWSTPNLHRWPAAKRVRQHVFSKVLDGYLDNQEIEDILREY